jgi:lysophospholipase L1-like esterase
MATAAATLAAVTLTPTAHAAPAAAPLAGTVYAALGDSYSAGSGVLPVDTSAPLECARSTANYPHDIAGTTGADLTDVTCGGAETKDFTSSQYPGVAPQLDALGPDTGLVTLTIGGNDNNTFVGAILDCAVAAAGTLEQGSPCKDQYGTSFTDTVDTKTYPAVKAALQAVHDKAPNARVAVLGYPWILPATADPSCWAKMPIASGDVPYLRDLQTHLNDAVQRAAQETGSTYVDFSSVSEGHDACAPSGTRWIEPALFGSNYVPVHPNATGEQEMADQTMSALGLG